MLIQAPQMTVNDFFWGVLVFGSIITPVVRWMVKKAWLWFIHLSKRTVRIWYTYKKRHAEQTIAHANEFLQNSDP